MVKWQRNINITNCPHAWGTPSMRARTRRILHTFSDITEKHSLMYQKLSNKTQFHSASFYKIISSILSKIMFLHARIRKHVIQ